MDPRTQALINFSKGTGRGRPVFFGGRKDEIEDVEEDLQRRIHERMDWDQKGPPPVWKSPIWIFQGAPGAGKTAFLERLESLTFKPPGLRSERPVSVCMINRKSELHEGNQLEKKIAEAFVPGMSKKLEGLQTTRHSLKAQGGAEARISAIEAMMVKLKGLIELAGSKSKTLPIKVWEEIENEIRNDKRYSPVLLMIDEAQNIPDEAKDNMEWLHLGTHGLPIIPILGGLAWTAEHLAKRGIDISRSGDDRVRLLQELSEDECGEVVDAFFDKPEFGVIASPEEREQWKEWLVEKSDGWAHHLNAGLKALARELGREGVGRKIRNVNEQAVFDEEKRIRHQYYDARLGGPRLKKKRYLAAAAVEVIEMSGQGMTQDELGDEIEEIHSQAVSEKIARLRLPAGMSGEEFADAMLKSGLLHERNNGELFVPIPCFQTYLIEFLNRWRKNTRSRPKKDDAPSSGDLGNPPDPGAGM